MTKPTGILVVDREEGACWGLHRWDHGLGRLSVLAWGGLWEAKER